MTVGAGPYGEHLELLTVLAWSPAVTGAGIVTVARSNEPDPESVDCPVAGAFTPVVGGRVWVETGSGSWVAVAAEATGAGGAYAVRLRKTVAGAVADNTPGVIINFDGVSYDYGDLFDPAANDRITFPVKGVYGFGTNFRWADQASPVGRRIADIVKNAGGAAVVVASHRFRGLSTDNVHLVAAEHEFVAGDFIRLSVFQSSGGPLSVASDPDWGVVLWATLRYLT